MTLLAVTPAPSEDIVAKDPIPATLPAWHATILPKTDADVWLAAGFASYERVVALEKSLRKSRSGALSEANRERVALALFPFRADYELGSRAGGDTPLIHFAGQTSYLELLALYRSAAALAYPSRYEGFGLPLLEAMACGTPVIAAGTSSIPEVVGDAAVLLDPDDEAGWIESLTRVLDDESHAGRLRAAGIARARKFSWRRTAEATARVYRMLLRRLGGS